MGSALQSWSEILRTQNPPREGALDAVSRWLLITRASVLPMTLTSGAIGGLLAARAPGTHWPAFGAALVGLVLAHAGNNMINDYFDLESGLDREQAVRQQYAPHPVLSGLISKEGLLLAIAVVNLLDLAILLALSELRGWPVPAVALLGLAISVFYVAPPLRLKHRGLGEASVLLVWGPLMIGGCYFVATGSLPPWVLVASLPFALLAMAVLMGKHVDKLEADRAHGVRTLAVILGRERALFLTQELLGGFFALTLCLVLVGTLGAGTLVSFLALPRLVRVLRVYARPRPEQAPAGFPIWPLWYAAWAFGLTRFAGALFALGLLLDAVYPVHL
jgi:1,4-dihydroxy-2-naphthoate octaprenyltransferase